VEQNREFENENSRKQTGNEEDSGFHNVVILNGGG
jgi:hypothetical protein